MKTVSQIDGACYDDDGADDDVGDFGALMMSMTNLISSVNPGLHQKSMPQLLGLEVLWVVNDVGQVHTPSPSRCRFLNQCYSWEEGRCVGPSARVSNLMMSMEYVDDDDDVL